MAQEGKIKTSYEFDPIAKRKLRHLKNALQDMDLVGVSEVAILEVLIDGAKASALKSAFKKRVEE